MLVCIDERHIARLIQVNLERRGHTVACVFDGDEPIRMLESTELLYVPRFDDVVLDARLPKMDGYEVLGWIRVSEFVTPGW